MPPKTKKKLFVWLLAILVLAAILRIPGFFWGFKISEKPHFRTYDEGEYHLAWIAKLIAEGVWKDETAYPKGLPFAMAMGTLAWWPQGQVDDPELILTGRAIALFYSLMMILLQFYLVRIIFRDFTLAFVSTMMLALMGFFVTKGHIASADPALLFWMYAVMFFSYRSLVQKKYHLNIALAMAACGLTLAYKMNFLVLIPVLYVLVKRKMSWRWYLIFPLALFMIVVLATGGRYTWTNLLLTFNNVAVDNMDVRQYNKLLNLPLYLFLLPPALGLPVFLFFVYGGFLLFIERFKCDGKCRDIAMIILLPVMLHVISICSLGYVGVRHIMPAFPLFAILAAKGFRKFTRWPCWANKKRLALVVWLLLIYQLIYIGAVEYYFVVDTRKAAENWIMANIPKGATIALPRHSVMPWVHEKFRVVDSLSADYLVMHEVNYARYTRSYLNPLTDYPGWREVFHYDPIDYHLIQGIFRRELPYRLVRKFEAKPVTPEIMLYKKYLGTFTDCYGDVLIFQKTSHAEKAPQQ